MVVEGAPDREVVVDRDRIVDAADPVDRAARRWPTSFSNANSGACTPITTRPWSLVLLRPGAHIGQRAQAVDAGIGPEVDQHDLAAQAFGRERRRVQPFTAPASDGSAPSTGSVRRACRAPRRCPPASVVSTSGWRLASPARRRWLRRRSSSSSACSSAAVVAGRNPRQQAGVQARARWRRRPPGPPRRGRAGPIRRRRASASWPRTARPPISSASASEVAAPAA